MEEDMVFLWAQTEDASFRLWRKNQNITLFKIPVVKTSLRFFDLNSGVQTWIDCHLIMWCSEALY